MAKDKIESIDDLKELAKNSFRVLKPCKNRKGKATVEISVNSYAELSYFLIYCTQGDGRCS